MMGINQSCCCKVQSKIEEFREMSEAKCVRNDLGKKTILHDEVMTLSKSGGHPLKKTLASLIRVLDCNSAPKFKTT